MSFQSATQAQRIEVRDSTSKAATATQKFAQKGQAPTTEEAALITPVLQEAADALTAVGISTALPATQAVVINNGTVPVQNSAGAAIANATLTVANNAVTAAKLPATQAAVANAAVRTVPITFVTARTAGQQATVAATFTVANGVITAISIA